MTEKKEETKKKTIDDKLIEYHLKFLDAIKDVYPLAVLGSLCIAIAAFTGQNYQDIQPYAITAAALFLIAFTVSFMFRIFNNYLLALVSFICTALAIVFLLLVVITFAQAIPVVGKSVSAVSDIFYISIFSISAYAVYKLRRKTESRAIRFCYTIAFPVLAIAVFFYAFNMAARFADFSIPAILSEMPLIVISLFGLISMVISIIEIRNRRIAKKNNAKQQVAPPTT